jgi:1-acyl-sn-glycerol-3-phosphate acyltransferase
MMRMGGMIPVRRFEADLGALRRAQDLLRSGGCLGMFPEGTRSHGAGLGAGEPGSALIALRSGAPIVPIAIWGTEHVKLPRDLFFKRTRVHIRFGEPFHLPTVRKATREDIESGTRRIMRAIAEMLPPEFRGVYSPESQGVTNP